MAEIASWNKHEFEVKPKLIKSFEDLTMKGACETTDKTANNQKYVERKAGEATQISFVVMLNALTGCKNVYEEAETFAREARSGATDYMYLGSRKLGSAKMMLVSAEVQEVVTQPGRGDVWISCKVKLTMKQGSPSEDGSGSGSGSGSGGPPWTATYYYSASSGALNKIVVSSNISYTDALNKAKAKVPGNALWSGTKQKQATNQGPKMTDASLEQARTRAANAAIQQGKEASEEKKPEAGLDAWTVRLDKATATT